MKKNSVINSFLMSVPICSKESLYAVKSPLICKANQWTGFYMIRTSVVKELRGDRKVQGSQQFCILIFPELSVSFCFQVLFPEFK